MLHVFFTQTVSLTDMQINGVTCENCECEYYYVLRRKASASASSQLPFNAFAEKFAAWMAMGKLKSRMKECDPAACPDCGWYQRNMVSALGRRRYNWLLWISIFLVICLGFQAFTAFGPVDPYWLLTTVAFAGTWLILRFNHLPNASAHSRAGVEAPPSNPILTRDVVLELIESPDVEPYHRSIYRSGMERFDQQGPGKFERSSMGSHANGFVPIEVQQGANAKNKISLAVCFLVLAAILWAGFTHIDDMVKTIKGINDRTRATRTVKL